MIELSILQFFLILVRVSSFFAALPIWGRGTIPKTVIIGLSLSLTALWFYQQPSFPFHLTEGQPVSFVRFFAATAAEALTGFSLGLAFGIFIYPLQIAGSYLAQEMGLSMASISDPSTRAQSDVLSSFLQTLGLILFFVLNLHHFVFQALDASFLRLPLGQFLSPDVAWVSIEALCRMEAQGLNLIAPVGICLFAILVILLLLTKAAPTLNLFSIGLSIRIAAGLFFLIVFAPNILEGIQHGFESGEVWIEEWVEAMSGT